MALSFDDYMNQPFATRITLVFLSNGSTNYYLSDLPYITDIFGSPNHTAFNHIISKSGLPRINWKISDPLSGHAVKTYGDLKLSTYLLNDGTDLRQVNLRGFDVTVKLVAPYHLYSINNAVLLFTGKVGKTQGDVKGGFTLVITDKQHEINSISIPPNRYDATLEGPNFPQSSDGRVKPLTFGSPWKTEPVLIDQANLWYQWHDVSDVIAVGVKQIFDNGSLLEYVQNAVGGSNTTVQFPSGDSSSINDYYNETRIYFLTGNNAGQNRKILDYDGSTHTATVNTLPYSMSGGDTFKVELYEDDTNNGRFRLLSTPAGQVTVDADGALYKNIPDTSAGDILELILTRFGGMSLPDLSINITSLDDPLNGIYLKESIRLSELVSRICRAQLAWWSFDRAGKFIAKHFTSPEVSATQTFYKTDIFNLSWSTDEFIVWRFVSQFHINWTILTAPNVLLTEPIKRTYRTAFYESVDEDLTVKSNFNNAIEFPHLSYSIAAGPPTGIVSELKNLFGVERYSAKIEVPLKLPLLNLGDTIEINIGDSFLDGNWLVRGIGERLGGVVPTQELELWR